jgi:hypothetical protein
MFYYAMLVSGVPERLAKVMYGAVYLGGPRWTIQAEKKFASAQDLKFVARELDEKSDSNDRVQVEVGFRDRMEEAARTVKYEGRAQDVVDQLNRGNALPNSAQTFYVDSIKVISIERGQLDEAGFKKLRRFIESNNPSLEQIRAFKP